MITAAWSSRRVSVGYIWEETYPALAGVSVFALVLWHAEDIACVIVSHNVELGNLYAAVAGIFAVITGFLATFYGSIQGIIDTRLRRISKTTVFRRFIRYIKIATKIGFAIALLSIPYIIFAPSTDGALVNRILVAAWCGACILGFAAFVRAARLLFFIFEYQPPEDEGAS